MALWNHPMFKFGKMITAPFVRQLIQQAGLFDVSQGQLVVLDKPCGSGIITVLGNSTRERLEFTCGDVSQGMVDVVQQRITDNNWQRATA